MEWVFFVVGLAKRSSTLARSMYEGRGAGQLRASVVALGKAHCWFFYQLIVSFHS